MAADASAAVAAAGRSATRRRRVLPAVCVWQQSGHAGLAALISGDSLAVADSAAAATAAAFSRRWFHGGRRGAGGGSGQQLEPGDIDLGDDAGAFIIVVIAVIVVAAAVFWHAFYAIGASAPTFCRAADRWRCRHLATAARQREGRTRLAGDGRASHAMAAGSALVLFWAFGGLIEFMAPGATTVGQACGTTAAVR